MTEIEKKFIACLIKQKVTSFKMSLCQHSETTLCGRFLYTWYNSEAKIESK